MRNLNSGRSTLNRNLESSVDTLPWLSLNAHPAATFQRYRMAGTCVLSPNVSHVPASFFDSASAHETQYIVASLRPSYKIRGKIRTRKLMGCG